MGVQLAIARALANEDQDVAETRWFDAVSSVGFGRTWGGARFGSRIIDSRSIRVRGTQSQAWEPVRRLGGEAGWYYANPLWRLRGFLDQLIGGPGLRRGRPDPETLMVGDAVDFWRVEDCLLYTSPSPRDGLLSRMPSSA